MSDPTVITPIQALVIAEAYIILADKKALPEERATLVALLGKHINKKELTQHQIQSLTADAFAYVERHEFSHFLLSIESVLTPAQVYSAAANMYETMIVDGRVITREKEIFEEFVKFFDIDKRALNTIREILVLKNDTGLFLRKDHPHNGSDFGLKFLSVMDLDPNG